MMENTPLKFRLLEYIEANPDLWNDEIVPEMQSEYTMNTDHGRNMRWPVRGERPASGTTCTRSHNTMRTRIPAG